LSPRNTLFVTHSDTAPYARKGGSFFQGVSGENEMLTNIKKFAEFCITLVLAPDIQPFTILKGLLISRDHEVSEQLWLL
jgi:hypothetical protein